MKRLHEFERKEIISIARKYDLSAFSIGMIYKTMKDFNQVRNHLSLTLSLVVSKRTPISHLRN
jgi:hypothetical protein